MVVVNCVIVEVMLRLGILWWCVNENLFLNEFCEGFFLKKYFVKDKYCFCKIFIGML